jgi:hypothetical protein
MVYPTTEKDPRGGAEREDFGHVLIVDLSA